MKRILITLAIVLPLVGLLAQEFKSREPTPTEKRFVGGLNYYPAEANDAVWQFYGISNSGTNIFLAQGTTNNIVAFTGANAFQTNIVVLPNPTNSVGALFNIVSSGIITTIISNSTIQSFNNVTNPPGSAVNLAIYQLNTNRAVKVFSTGTNWFVLETKL